MSKSLIWSNGRKAAWLVRLNRFPSEWIGMLEGGHSLSVTFQSGDFRAIAMDPPEWLEYPLTLESITKGAYYERLGELRIEIQERGRQIALVRHSGNAGPDFMEDSTMMRILGIEGQVQ